MKSAGGGDFKMDDETKKRIELELQKRKLMDELKKESEKEGEQK